MRSQPSASWWVPGIAPHERASGVHTRPAWAAVIDEVAATGGDAPLDGLVTWASAQVSRVSPDHVAMAAVVAAFGEQLRGLLTEVAERTLAVGTRELAGYPVLARLAGETARLAVEAHVELLTRFAADRDAVVTTLLGGADPGPVVAVEARHGDPHRCGRSVSVVVFADGRRVVYRPRDVTTHVRFAELVAWLDAAVPGLALRTPAVVVGNGYGWLEFVEDSQPAGHDGAGRYFRRLGALLALLHVVRATDMHYQNVVADGDLPVLVDVETLFHPTLPHRRAADPATRALTASVYRTGLLPQFVAGTTGITDISGAGRTDPADHTAALLDGFRHAYDAVRADKAGFATLMLGHTGMEVRVVTRSTRQYSGVLAAATDPGLLRDAADRDRVLAAAVASGPFGDRLATYELADLWAGDIPLFTGRPDSRDLWTSGGRRLPDLVERTGLADALDTVAAMSEVDRRDQEWVISAAMAARTAPDHHDPTPVPADVTGTPVDPQRLLTAACAIADQIVSRSMADRDRVNWLGLELVDERQWLVLPMGAGLANGYLGVALFLAQLAEVSGVTRYGQVAMDALTALPALLETLRDQPATVAAIGRGGLHGLGGIAYGLARIAALRDDAEVRKLAMLAVELAASPAAATDEHGWATGTAGCLAAMTAVHTELALPSAAELARHCADQLATEVNSSAAGFADRSALAGLADRSALAASANGSMPAGFAGGSVPAGTADGPMATGFAGGPMAAGSAGGSMAAGLADGSMPAGFAGGSTPAGSANDPMAAGFADGAAGVSWALTRYAARLPDVTAHHTDAARTATRLSKAASGDGTRFGWCTGLAGLVLGGTRQWTPALVDRAPLRDLSLCHGELGIAEAVAVTATPDGEPLRRRYAGLVLDAVDRHGPRCGTPGGVPTPGLLTGLAGIGYGLLRLGFGDQVPSALLLEPRERER